MPTSTLTSKGQITLPKAVREALDLRTGDQVEFVRDISGDFRLRATRADVRSLKGLLHKAGRKAVSLEAMQAAIERQGTAKR